MKKGIIIAFVLVGLASIGLAQQSNLVLSQSGTTTQLNTNIAGMSIGYVKVGTEEIGNLAWHPDFKLGVWGVGFDVNIPLGDKRPSGYENVILRYAAYDDGSKGLRYGVVDNLTWGHGMLMKGYSTRVAGPVILNSQQLALLGYVDINNGMSGYTTRALATRTNLYGLRLEERLSPLWTLGQSYITDVDGVQIPGTGIIQKVSGVGIDATTPLPLNFEGYAEWASLLDRGNGLSVGISWAYNAMVADASFLAEYRLLSKGFIPGYFDVDYETNPINLASAEATGDAKNGYLAQFGLNALGLASLNVVYENYNESNPALNADLLAKMGDQVKLVGYYKQPKFSDFRALSIDQGAILGGALYYKVNPYSTLVANYKKIYNPSTKQVEESTYYEVVLGF